MRGARPATSPASSTISDLRVMDDETQALAGEGADVAVVVGSDKAP